MKFNLQQIQKFLDEFDFLIAGRYHTYLSRAKYICVDKVIREADLPFIFENTKSIMDVFLEMVKKTNNN